MKFSAGDIVYMKGRKRLSKYDVVEVRERPYTVIVKYRGGHGKERAYEGRKAERMFGLYPPPM